MIWCEKYRPRTFADVVGLPKEIPTMLENLPHLLFLGKPGTGKTTTAKIIIKTMGCDCLLLNASDERGIQTIRDKVKNFAVSQSTDGKVKVVFLDEADFLTSEAQNSLRNLMETYHNNCRFICTGNYENRIVDALKSRMTPFKFETNDEETLAYIRRIATAEKMDIGDATLQKIIKHSRGDIRKCVVQLQRLSELKRPIRENDINKEQALPELVHNVLKNGDFIQARQILLDSTVEYDVFLEEYHAYVLDLFLNKKELTKPQFAKIINNLADAISKINLVMSKEIIVENMLLRIIEVLNNA